MSNFDEDFWRDKIRRRLGINSPVTQQAILKGTIKMNPPLHVGVDFSAGDSQTVTMKVDVKAILQKIEDESKAVCVCPTCGTVLGKLPDPVRIQRKRSKGWRMPENTVCVTRPGKFGNPFKIVGNQIFGDASHRHGKYLSPWILIEVAPVNGLSIVELAIDCYKTWIHGINKFEVIPAPSYDAIKSALRGKNLACFCKVGAPCHADVLLKIANS